MYAKIRWKWTTKNKKKGKKSKKNLKKKIEKNIFAICLGSKSRNREEFTKLRPKTESRNSGDHEFWNHEMRGSPVAAPA